MEFSGIDPALHRYHMPVRKAAWSMFVGGVMATATLMLSTADGLERYIAEVQGRVPFTPVLWGPLMILTPVCALLGCLTFFLGTQPLRRASRILREIDPVPAKVTIIQAYLPGDVLVRRWYVNLTSLQDTSVPPETLPILSPPGPYEKFQRFSEDAPVYSESPPGMVVIRTSRGILITDR